MNEIKIFENAEFGSVRTIEIDEVIYFVGKDVAEILGYSNPQKAIRDHVDEEDKTVNDLFTVNGTKGLLITESGLYSLILSSKLPNAKKFKRWVTSEVLPSIRKDVQKNKSSELLTALIIGNIFHYVGGLAVKEFAEFINGLSINSFCTVFKSV